ncbi:thioredoxin family protein [uncultured Erythrobacter sp.]|uniref:DUF1223 domain-containing protein n=1 Tax=uncultured Erythrobacter sp. TaxID=263913 RepID=UPI002638C784|nr:DUF1223 domain-containing protein [uncultured Erythrobacter sp.]
MRSCVQGILIVGAAICAGLVLLPGSSGAQTFDDLSEPVLIELFTSQGCSSCPPADRLAERLNQEEGLVVISRPVTYWDRLGWKDTLASQENTDLQYAYAERGLVGYSGVYTPQSVVSGRFGEIGSRERALRRKIAQGASIREAVIRVRGDTDKGFGIGLAGETQGQAELVLIGVDRQAAIDIGRGENRGRRIAYTNVLKNERRLALWQGGQASHVLEANALDIRGADRYALILREVNAGPVLAARWLN